MLTTNLSVATISREKFTTDIFKKFRAPKSTHIVGVWAELTMVNNIEATDDETNSAEQDVYSKLSLWYDLELDEEGKILGGEWHDSVHPDFLWVVAPNIKPFSIQDYTLYESVIDFNPGLPLPPRVQQLAIKSSQNKQILYWIIEKILYLSTADG